MLALSSIQNFSSSFTRDTATANLYPKAGISGDWSYLIPYPGFGTPEISALHGALIYDPDVWRLLLFSAS